MFTLVADPSVGFLESYLWQFATIIVAIVAVIGFLVYRYYIEPPIARQMTSAKWKQGSPAFIQDDAGVVHFTTNNIELPEGVVHNKRGWFLRGRSPYIPSDASATLQRGVGRPPNRDAATKSVDELSTEETEKVLDTVLQAPILAGLGKAVFFGYDGAPLLSNLKTLVHADLRVMKEIIPATISRTQLAALHRWSLAKGYEKKGGDQMKFLMVCVGAAIILGSLGLVVYLIMNGGSPA